MDRRRRRGLLKSSLAAGLVAGLLVGALGWAVAGLRPQGWQAETRVAVLPGSDVSSDELAAYYETLSRGQLVATAAEILGQSSFRTEAAEAIDVPAGASISVEATVIPETALVSVAATAPTADLAERLADEASDAGQPTADRLLAPYDVTTVSSADGTAGRTGLSTLQYALVVAFAAAVAAVAVQQLVQQLGSIWVDRSVGVREDADR